MSYNSHYGGSSSNPSSNGDNRERDRDRDRDRDRGYYPRYPNQQKRFSPGSGYQEQLSLRGYRRQDNREYYGYRSGYGRGNSSGASSGLQNNRRRPDKYDSYQGSKYRPSSRGKSGPPSGQTASNQNNSPWNSSSANHTNAPGDYDNGYYSQRNSYDERYDARGDEPGIDFADERRTAGRKNDWDSPQFPNQRSHYRNHHERDQYKPEGLSRSERRRSDSLNGPEGIALSERLSRPEGTSSSKKTLNTPENLDRLRSQSVEPRAAESNRTTEEIANKEQPVKDERLLHLFDEPEEPEVKNANEVKSQAPEESRAIAPEQTEVADLSKSVKIEAFGLKKASDNLESLNDSDHEADKNSSKVENAKKESSKAAEEESSKAVDIEPTKEVATALKTSKEEAAKEKPAQEGPAGATSEEADSSATKQTNDKAEVQVTESAVETHNGPNGTTEQKAFDSPVAANIDTSMLSPVGSPISDSKVIRELNLIAEKEHQGVENDGDISEAETVVTEDTAPLDKAKSLLRKEQDGTRRKLKRKVIYSSDEEDEKDEDVATKTPESPTLAKVANMADAPIVSKAETHSTNEDDLNDSEAGSGDKEDKENKWSRKKKDYKIKRDSTGRSLLQRACKKGDLQEVKNLIARGADANENDFGGFTCLHEAALAGHTEIAEYLIDQGANVNKQALEFGDYETPLMDAAENKHIETVKVLLMHGADPDICNADGYSALTKLYHLQDEEEDYEGIIELLDAASQAGGKSSLQAVSQSPRRIIEDPTESYFTDLVRKKSSATIFKYLAQGLKESAAADFVTHAYSLQKTPDILNVAARNGHIELVDILLGLNPGSFDINQKNRIGVTVLLATVGRGYYDVVKFLLSKGADPTIKRDKDGLNALQVAKHSAQHDPREVILLEQYLSGQVPKDSKTPQPEKTGADAIDMDLDEPAPARAEKKRRLSEDRGGSMKRAKSKELEASPKELAQFHDPVHKSKEVSFKDTPIMDTDATEQSLAESPKQETMVKKEYVEESRQVSPPFDHDLKRQRLKSSASASPGPLTKAQEEQKIKAAEEAKHWQEKVQAKKRARKEMFLLAEREKEKKRKEDEVKKIEEMKQLKEKEVEEKMKEAEEAKRLVQEMEKKRFAMEVQSIIKKYPIGLQEASFDGSISDKERLKFAPLYVFEHEEESWVVDLQVALLLAAPVPDIHRHCNIANSPPISQAAKEAMWPLFFHMVGIGRHDRVDKQGCAKFKTLELRYLKLSEVALFVREQYPEVNSLIWNNGKLTRVKLDIKPEKSDSSVTPLVTEKTSATSFIPPKWRQRLDVLRTIRSANVPLW